MAICGVLFEVGLGPEIKPWKRSPLSQVCSDSQALKGPYTPSSACVCWSMQCMRNTQHRLCCLCFCGQWMTTKCASFSCLHVSVHCMRLYGTKVCRAVPLCETHSVRHTPRTHTLRHSVRHTPRTWKDGQCHCLKQTSVAVLTDFG